MSNYKNESTQDTLERLLAYSAAAGLGAFGAAQGAQASVIYGDINPDIIQAENDPEFLLDMNSDGIDDLRIVHVDNYAPAASSGWYQRFRCYPLGNTRVATNASKGNLYYVRSFGAGDDISNSNPDVQLCISPFSRVHVAYTNFRNLTDPQYAAIRLADSGGGLHWAWIRMKVTGTSSTNSLLTTYDYAYETDLYNVTGILAGDMGVTSIDGDLNGDGFVGLDDLDIVLTNWNQNVTPGEWSEGDPTGDGFVGLSDLDIVLNNWNNGTPPVAAVPEPATLGLLAVGLGAMACKRRRRM